MCSQQARRQANMLKAAQESEKLGKSASSPAVLQEGRSVCKRDLLECQKRPITCCKRVARCAKETY